MPIHTEGIRFDTWKPKETTQLGRRLGGLLKPGDVVLVSGELGAGKTCLIQGACLELGVDEPVTSPTFTLVNEYEGRVPVAHIDLYRLDDSNSALDIGLEEYMEHFVCLIEWGDKFPGIFPEDAIKVSIDLASYCGESHSGRGNREAGNRDKLRHEDAHRTLHITGIEKL